MCRRTDLPVFTFNISAIKQVIALVAARRYAPPPMAVRLAADLRPSADRSAVRTSLVAGQLQAASVPIA